MQPIVLVHGAWHGAWCWDPVVAPLRAAGAEVVAVDLPFTGLDDDAAAVADVLDGLGADALLVGHSYGGVVVSQAAAGRTDVAHLVYLAALVLGADDDLPTLLATSEPVTLNSAIRFTDDGLTVIDPALAPAAFYGHCDDALVADAVGRLRPFPIDSVRNPGAEPWRTIPSTYVVCLADDAVPAGLQRSMAAHCAAVEEWDTDHSPFASRPDETAALLLRLARPEP